jgi:hypothetical protein
VVIYVFVLDLSDPNFNFKVKTYKADLNSNIYFIIGVVIFFGVTIPMSSTFSGSSWILLFIFLALFIVFNIITPRLNEIQLDQINNSLTTIHKNYIGVRRITKYGLGEIEFTYKREATSFRGGIKNVCTIYSSGKKVIQLAPNNDDWSNDEIKSFVYGLIAADVKKKFIGYTLKDVEI